MLRSQADLDQLLIAPNRGRTVWVILAGEPTAETSRVMRDSACSLPASAVESAAAPPTAGWCCKLQL